MTREKIEQKAKELYPDEPLSSDEYTRKMRQSFIELFRKCFIQGAEFALSNQWVSVEDELPPQQRRCLIPPRMERYSQYVIMRGRFGIGGYYIGCYDFVSEKWLVRGDRGLEDTSMPVTHWMPIPPLAEEGGEK